MLVYIPRVYRSQYTNRAVISDKILKPFLDRQGQKQDYRTASIIEVKWCRFLKKGEVKESKIQGLVLILN